MHLSLDSSYFTVQQNIDGFVSHWVIKESCCIVEDGQLVQKVRLHEGGRGGRKGLQSFGYDAILTGEHFHAQLLVQPHLLFVYFSLLFLTFL